MQMNKRTKVLAGGIALAVVAGGGAYAYWTAPGSGSGSASTDTTVPLTVQQTTPTSKIYPGGSVALAGTVTNPNPGPVRAGSVTVTGITVDTVSAAAGCLATDYTVSGTAAVNADVAGGSGTSPWSGLSLNMANSATLSQDACKNAVVTIAYAVS